MIQRLPSALLPAVVALCGCSQAPILGVVTDASTTDATVHDSGSLDSGATDSGSLDSGATDSGSPDSGATDAGSMDAGSLDGGAHDLGGADAGTIDAGASCGDGVVTTPETCDDANVTDGDGCDHACSLELGYDCVGGTAGHPSYCFALCGDGNLGGYEQCDDGNLVAGDGCSPLCLDETTCEACIAGTSVPPSPSGTYSDGLFEYPLNDCDPPAGATDPWTTGIAAGASWRQLCGDLLRCFIQTDCMRLSSSGALSPGQYGACYCGPDRPTGSGWCTTLTTGGPCARVMHAGLGTSTPSETAGALTASARPAGYAVAMLSSRLMNVGSDTGQNCNDAAFCLEPPPTP